MSSRKQKLKSGLNSLFSSPEPVETPAAVAEEVPPAPPPTPPAETVAPPPAAETPSPAPPAEEPASPAAPPKVKKSALEGDESFDDNETQLVVFKMGDEFFGVDISIVESIIKIQEITLVPHAHLYVEGVTNLRGTVVPVIDLRTRFSMPRVEPTKDTRIIVVEHEGAMIGMVVDAVTEVLRIPSRVIEPPSAFVAGFDSAFITGIAKFNSRLITMLDFAKIFVAQDSIEKHAAKSGG